jgi:signal peptide peptidase SppA
LSRDYLRIGNKILEANWFITSAGLDLILSIYQARVNGQVFSDEELAARLTEAGAHGSDVSRGYEVRNNVAVLPIYGPIFGKANMMTELSGATSLEMFRQNFKSALSDEGIKHILLDVDSPGGTSEMVPETGAEIFAARDIKPVTAVANTEAGSAAFWLATQANKFYMNPSGSVGSLGAYTVHQDVSQADHQRGIKYTYVSAGKYKVEGSPHLPLSKEGIDYRQEVINELYDEFVSAVSTGRNLDSDFVEANFGQGRMIGARRAVENKMVDGVMEFDAVMASIQDSQPTVVSLHISGERIARAVLDSSTNAYRVEAAEWEHSEPGTGSPPQPRLPEGTERDVASGSRRPDLTPGIPNEALEPGAPRANSNGRNTMDEERLNELYALLGVDNDEDFVRAVTEMHSESSALRSAVSEADRDRLFAEQFPEQYNQHMTLVNKDRMNEAKAFAARVSVFTSPQGNGLVNTKYGLGSLAIQTIEELHAKFARGEGNLADFENVVSRITQGGMVEYGERGSSQSPELPNIDTTTASGVQDARQLFAQKVSEVQREDKLSFKDAVVETAKRYPDLYQAWRATANA